MEARPITARLLGALAACALLALAAAAGATAAAKPLSQPDETLYRSAFRAADSGKWSYVRALAAKAEDKLLGKVLVWLEVSRSDTDAGFAERADFLRANPDWPEAEAIRQAAEEAMTEATPDADVIAWFAEHEPLTTHGLVRYAEALERAGERDKAEALYRKAWAEGSFGLSEERTFLARHRRALRAEDHIARLDGLLWDGQFDAAKRVLPRVDKGYQALADARRRLRLMEGAVDWAVGRVPRELANDPGLLYDRLRWRRRKDLDSRAQEILFNPPDNLVRPEAWWTERAIIARHALLNGDISVSYKLASRHGLSEGAALVEAEWLSGWIALRFLQEGEAALAHFARAHEASRYPVSQARGAYWAGRAAELIPGKEALAAEWYRRAAGFAITYHGQLAAHKLGGGKDVLLPSDPQPTPEDVARFESRELVAATRQLGQIDEQEQMRPFLLRLQQLAETPGETALVAELALSQNRPDVAITVAKRAVRGGVILVDSGYPVPHAVEGDEPEPALVLAMMRQESAFDTLALSSAGARGLMQLMPATAKQIARNLGIDYSRKRLHSDPGYNLRLGTAYLADLLGRFDGSYVLAIAAYNAGPARLRGWIKENGDPRSPAVDAIDWVEMIPFTETRDYVQRVLENLQVYRARAGKTTVVQSLADDLHLRE